jgi:hypothetical protein
MVATPESIAKAKAACEQEREAAMEKVPELRRLLMVAQPLLTRTPLSRRVACQDAIDKNIETFGLTLVVRCLALVLAANGIDISTKTINDLAQEVREQ